MTKTRAGLVTIVLLAFAAALAGCGPGDEGAGGSADAELLRSIETEAREGAKMRLTSTFKNGEPIATKHTEDGDNVSPPLAWIGAPEAAKTFVLICDDPDAPSPRNPHPEPWVHWVIYNISGDVSELPEGVPQDAKLATPPGAKQGANSWGAGNFGYRGPSPPVRSGTHRYFFKLYALDTELDLDPPGQVTKNQLLQAMQNHILGHGELMGTYERE